MTMSQFTRNALLLDAVVSGAAAVLMTAGAGLLAPHLAIPEALLFWAGIVLVPFVTLLLVLARRAEISRLMLIDVIGLNVAWVLTSVGLIVTGTITPTLLGHAFVLAQAGAVAVFAALQAMALMRAGSVRA